MRSLGHKIRMPSTFYIVVICHTNSVMILFCWSKTLRSGLVFQWCLGESREKWASWMQINSKIPTPFTVAWKLNLLNIPLNIIIFNSSLIFPQSENIPTSTYFNNKSDLLNIFFPYSLQLWTTWYIMAVFSHYASPELTAIFWLGTRQQIRNELLKLVHIIFYPKTCLWLRISCLSKHLG